MISAFYAVLAALYFLKCQQHLTQLRRQYRVMTGDGGFSQLQAALRIVEYLAYYLPISLLLMLFAEMNAVPIWLLHLAGIGLFVGQTLHAYAINRRDYDKYRLARHTTTIALVLLILANLYYLPWASLFIGD